MAHRVEWEFLPAPGREAEFLAAYGPAGAWAKLFRRGEGYLGTDLAPTPGKPGWFRTIDSWKSKELYDAFRAAFAEEYRRLDEACEKLTRHENENPLGGRGRLRSRGRPRA